MKQPAAQSKNEAANSAALVAVVESSGFVRGVERVVGVVCEAGRTSAVVALVTGALGAWLRQSLIDRIRLSGVALVSAAVVHLALMLWHGPTPGWLWLVVPALAVGFGGLMMLAPARGLADEAHR